MTSLRSGSVAADSNVLLSAVARRGAWRVFEETDLVVVTTDFNIAEVEEYMPEFGERYGIEMDRLYAAVETLPVVRYGESEYMSHLKKARRYLDHRDPDDVHLAALALKLNIPVWSNDRDLTELPLEVYTTARLLKALGL